MGIIEVKSVGAHPVNLREHRDRISRAFRDVQQNHDRVTRRAVESIRERAQRCIALGGTSWRGEVDMKLSILVNMKWSEVNITFTCNWNHGRYLK